MLGLLGESWLQFSTPSTAFGTEFVGYPAYPEVISAVIDEIDREILRHVQREGRATHRELGRAVGLSPNAAGARLARLMERGTITGFQATIDHATLGRPIDVVIDAWLDTRPGYQDNFIELVAADDRIVEAVNITGPVDYRVRARVESPEDLQDLLVLLKSEGKVTQTDSRIVLATLPTTQS